MSGALPKFCYGDPANCCDELRRVQKVIDQKTNNCAACKSGLGKVFGRQVCRAGKQPDQYGYCDAWKGRKA